MELGGLLIKLGQPSKALEQLLVAEKQAPLMSLVHCTKAKVYREMGRKSETIQAARRCADLDPQSAEAHYLLGQLYQQAGQPELARQEVELFQRLKGAGP